eukprot:TRINITY_DN4841_c0_g1_i1.p1 TRINITY_DN4841_c0_g1~~TRINITY_DN4841_c0_g1_i1.p1  ORF type:complete len:101 (-),score=3.32 TRINITY_DN4841_c0_g1_i1:388-690(-)
MTSSFESIPLTNHSDISEQLSIKESIKSHPFYVPISNILLWNNLWKSFSFFSIGTLFFVLVIYAEYSVTSLLSATLLIILAVRLAYIASYELRGLNNPLK